MTTDRTGWYEFVMPGGSTTHVAYVYEDGSVYLPDGTPEEVFRLASATNRFCRLVPESDTYKSAALIGELTEARQQLEAVKRITESEHVPPPEIREGYEAGMRAIRRAVADPDAVLHPIDRCTAGESL